VTKDTIWQRIGDDSVPATGALLFACLLAAITVWFSAGAIGPWLAVLGLGLTLVTLAFDSMQARSLLIPIFLGASGVGLALFSGGFVGVASCAVLWPVLGAIALGGRFINALVASACALVGLVMAGSLLPVTMPSAITQQSGILALGVSGALLLAACLRIQADRLTAVRATHASAQLSAATISRDEALAQAKEAKEQTRGRAQFMAEMSHEIRTPLNAILGFADTMREGVFGPLPQAYGDYPDLIHTSGTHLLDLVSDLLDLSKIEAGRYDTNLKALRLDDVAYEGVRLSSGAARAAGVQIRHEASAPIEIEGDARALRQIVFNLISNAIKFTPSGGRVTVRVIVDPEKQQATLEVEDTGVGIGAADLAKIGEPWNQSVQTAEGTAKTSRGSGLGLALVKRLTDLQSGQFQISSHLGAGTRARVTFPLAKPTAS
jgi:signal transduction histidine kinase